MADEPLASQDISEDEVRAHLARVLASPAFLHSPQLGSFLRFVVEETLAGRSAELKGYTIATRALGRPESFDPQVDPIVRVQAGRVRQALAEFAAAEPRQPLSITLERGSYRPIFSRRSDAAPPPMEVETAVASPATAGKPAAPPKPARPPIGFWPVAIRLIALVIMLGVLFVVWRLPPGPPPAPAPAKGTNSGYVAPPLFVPQLVVDVAGLDDVDPPTAFASRVRDAIGRFDDLVVVSDEATSIVRSGGSSTISRQFQLRISAQPAGVGTTRYSARLTDAQTGRQVWSREYDPVASGPAGDDARTRIIQSIASTVAQPYGVLQAHLRTAIVEPNGASDAYGCLVAAFDYWLANDVATHLKARTCITDRLKTHPQASSLHAQLTYLHLEEFRQGFNPIEGDPLVRALVSARAAVRLAPASARAHQALLAAHFARKEMSEAWRAADEAMVLNPFDTEIMADIGARYVQTGQYERGLALLRHATELNLAPPTWALTFRALGLYMLDRVDDGAEAARALEGTSYAPAMIALVLSHYRKRDAVSVRRHLKALRETHPDIARDLSGYLDRLNFDRGTAGRVVTDFAAAERWLAQQL